MDSTAQKKASPYFSKNEVKQKFNDRPHDANFNTKHTDKWRETRANPYAPILPGDKSEKLS